MEDGDAGEALDLASAVDATGLSTERQSRLFIDLARAYAQRRHVGEAVQGAPGARDGQPPESDLSNTVPCESPIM
jgi:hypothetical protein